MSSVADAQGNSLPHTIISREYSREWKRGDDSYYPVIDEKNSALYQRYKTWADAEENVHFCGRLAEYRYFDMDTVVARTLSLCDEEFGT